MEFHFVPKSNYCLMNSSITLLLHRAVHLWPLCVIEVDPRCFRHELEPLSLHMPTKEEFVVRLQLGAPKGVLPPILSMMKDLLDVMVHV